MTLDEATDLLQNLADSESPRTVDALRGILSAVRSMSLDLELFRAASSDQVKVAALQRQADFALVALMEGLRRARLLGPS